MLISEFLEVKLGGIHADVRATCIKRVSALAHKEAALQAVCMQTERKHVYQISYYNLIS